MNRDNTWTEEAYSGHAANHQASGLAPAQSETIQPSVYIVLLNWNGWRDTLECVRSLRGMEYQNWHAVIVDNGSSDESVERLKEACPEATIVENEKNRGFAAGNNVGIRMALKNAADYVFVLNNDTTVFPDTLSELVSFAESHGDAAVMSPKILRHDPQTEWPIRRKLNLLTIFCTLTPLRRFVLRLPLLRGRFYYTDSEPAVVQFLPGSALFFRATTFVTAGLFDENTFLDYEEFIIAEKVRSAGLSAYFVPGAGIWHKGSASGSKLRAKRYIENAKSEEYFFSSYVRLSRFGRFVVRVIRFVTYAARAFRYENYRKHFGEFTTALWSNHTGSKN
jgi:GT2 family glycosyltransferase